MSKPIRISVDVTKIDKKFLRRLDDGRVFLNLVAFQLKNGANDRGETHLVKQSFPKDEGPGQDAPILGNLSLPQREEYRNEHTSPKPPAKAPAKADPRDEEGDSDIPF